MASAAQLAPEFKYRLLLQLSQKISRTLDLQDVLNQLLDSVSSTIDCEAAGIFVLEREVPLSAEPRGFVIAGMAKFGFPEEPPDDDPMHRFGEGIIGHVIATGENLIVPDVRKETRYRVGRATALSEVAVPIVRNERVIGALDLESDRLDAFSETDVELLEFFASAAAIAIEKAVLHREVLAKERLDQQLTIAKHVQDGLFPKAPPVLHGYELAGVHRASSAIGGDYYDYLPRTDGGLGLVIADVSGKGVPAALIMATFRAALRMRLRDEDEISGVVRDVNRLLLESSDVSRYVTAVCGILDPASGTLRYVNCGHNPPVLLRANGTREQLDPGAPVLGVFEQPRIEPATVVIEPGDVLVLYTDGVVELTDPQDEEFGLARLERTLRAGGDLPAADLVGSVVGATCAFSLELCRDDDFTLVVLRRAPAERGS